MSHVSKHLSTIGWYVTVTEAPDACSSNARAAMKRDQDMQQVGNLFRAKGKCGAHQCHCLVMKALSDCLVRLLSCRNLPARKDCCLDWTSDRGRPPRKDNLDRRY